MAKEEYPHNIFTGRWRVVSMYCNKVGEGWTLSKLYGRDSFIWEFTETGVVTFPTGNTFHCGVLKELFLGYGAGMTEFTYCSGDRILFIDRSDRETDGFVNICVDDQYFVERIRDGEYWLYDLENVENEPEDFRFRLKIRKIDQ